MSIPLRWDGGLRLPEFLAGILRPANVEGVADRPDSPSLESDYGQPAIPARSRPHALQLPDRLGHRGGERSDPERLRLPLRVNWGQNWGQALIICDSSRAGCRRTEGAVPKNAPALRGPAFPEGPRRSAGGGRSPARRGDISPLPTMAVSPRQPTESRRCRRMLAPPTTVSIAIEREKRGVEGAEGSGKTIADFSFEIADLGAPCPHPRSGARIAGAEGLACPAQARAPSLSRGNPA